MFLAIKFAWYLSEFDFVLTGVKQRVRMCMSNGIAIKSPQMPNHTSPPFTICTDAED